MGMIVIVWTAISGKITRKSAPSAFGGHGEGFYEENSLDYGGRTGGAVLAQKPEKLFAKLILASSNPGDLIFDPFLGSGTAAVTAKKLGRRFLGIEREEEYCALAQYRLGQAQTDPRIQGYCDGVFWERNTQAMQHAALHPPASGKKN